MNYSKCKKLFSEIENHTVDERIMSALLQKYTREEIIENLGVLMFTIAEIPSKQHCQQLLRDIKNGNMSDLELEMLFSLNDLSGTDEALFEIGKVIRRYDLIRASEKEFKAASEAMRSVIPCYGEINLMAALQIEEDIKELAVKMRKELQAELDKLDAEKYIPQ